MSAIASTRVRQIVLAAALGIAAAGMVGCGSGSGATSSEAANSDVPPARQESAAPGSRPAEKPSRVLVTVKGAPRGTGKITEAEFEQGMKQAASFRGLKQIPKPGSEEYIAMKNEVMGGLIIAIWAFGQAEDLKVKVSDQQMAAALRKEEDHLREAGFTQATMEERVKQALVTTNLEDRLKKRAKREHKNQFVLFHRADVEIETKWPPRTHCVKGFIVQQCGNYHASGDSE